jgi:hypothetical protein
VPLLLAAVLTALAWQYGGPVYVTAADVKPNSSAPVVNPRYSPRPCTRRGKSLTSYYAVLSGKLVWITKFDPCNYGRGRTRSVDDVFADLRSCDVPFFGQSGGFVYLGAISNVWRDRFERCHWSAGPIVERRRGNVRLRYRGGKIVLNQPKKRSKPYEAAWHAARSAWRKLHSPDEGPGYP